MSKSRIPQNRADWNGELCINLPISQENKGNKPSTVFVLRRNLAPMSDDEAASIQKVCGPECSVVVASLLEGSEYGQYMTSCFETKGKEALEELHRSDRTDGLSIEFKSNFMLRIFVEVPTLNSLERRGCVAFQQVDLPASSQRFANGCDCLLSGEVRPKNALRLDSTGDSAAEAYVLQCGW